MIRNFQIEWMILQLKVRCYLLLLKLVKYKDPSQKIDPSGFILFL
jgi:hypothetical protein